LVGVSAASERKGFEDDSSSAAVVSTERDGDVKDCQMTIATRRLSYVGSNLMPEP
jgi:hypothetical protein